MISAHDLSPAKAIARQIIEGVAKPNEGCFALAKICESHGWPDELLPFSALAHEQIGHEEFGFDKDNTALLIMEVCRVFLGENSL